MTPEAPVAPADNLTAMLRLVGLFRQTFTALLAAEGWLAESGARPATYGVLRVVAVGGPLSQREVCDALGTHASDMVEIVDCAERQGWVERHRDPDDRRRYRLTVTPAGRQVLARFDAVAAEAEARVLAPLADAERRTLVDLVAKVVESG